MSHDFLSRVVHDHIGMLKPLIGQIITEITRYSWLPPDEAAREYGLDEAETFFLTSGAVLITFAGGEIIGFASESSIASVICWKERDKGGRWRSESKRIDQDPELSPISATDPTYSTSAASNLVGDKLNEIAIWTRPPVDARWEAIPCEVAVRLVGDRGDDLWLTHGLHDDSDDFSVLKWEHIRPSLQRVLTPKLSVNSPCRSRLWPG